MFNKEKRQEKREERKAVKETLDDAIKPRPTFAQRQEKAALRKKRLEDNTKLKNAVAAHLQSLHAGEATGDIVTLGSELLYLGALSGIRIQILDQLNDGGKCFTRWTVYAKHDNEFLGMAPTNRDVEFGGVTISSVVEGEVTQELHYWDMVALLQQIQAP